MPAPPGHEIAASPELRVLLDIARTRVSSERSRRIRAALDGPLDAAALVTLAERHGLVPLLHHHLGVPGALPVPERQRLVSLARNSAMVNLALVAELHRLLDDLDASAIPVVPYKGPALAASLYGNFTLREFRDLDLLVRPSDVPRIQELLMRRGYLSEGTPAGLPLSLVLREACEIQFCRRRGRAVVEVHWALMPGYLMSGMDEGVWERLVPSVLGHRQVRALSTEDLLVFLCAHGAKHGWERISWLTDVAECVSSAAALDWDAVMMRARETRARRALGLGLLLARDLLDAPVPGDVLDRPDLSARDPSLRALANSVLARWDAGQPLRARDTVRFHLATRDGAGDRVRYLALRAVNLNEHDWGLMALPPALAGLYYPLRLVRLAAEGIARLRAAGRHVARVAAIK